MPDIPQFSDFPKPPRALLLDFDGVIVESVALKIKAFVDIYADEEQSKLDAIADYQRVHGGVTRGLKFKHFESEIFGRSADDARISELSGNYAQRVYEAVVACPFVPGAIAFLRAAHGKTDIHVISGTPVAELENICRRRDLSKYFTSIHGAPVTKREAFRSIVHAYGYQPETILAIGDATTEWQAARELSIPFLGVVAEPALSPFPVSLPVVETLEGLERKLGFV